MREEVSCQNYTPVRDFHSSQRAALTALCDDRHLGFSQQVLPHSPSFSCGMGQGVSAVEPRYPPRSRWSLDLAILFRVCTSQAAMGSQVPRVW